MNCSNYLKRVVSTLLVSCSIISTGCASGKNAASRAETDTITTQAVANNEQSKVGNKPEVISKQIKVDGKNNPVTAKSKEFYQRQKQKLTLAEALNKAADYSWTIKVAKSQLDIAESRLDQAKAKYYPTVGGEITAPNVRYDGGINSRDRDFDDTAFAGIDVRYSIYDFGRRDADKEAASYNFRASGHAKHAEDLTVLYDTANAYLAVQSYSEQLNSATEYVSKIEALNKTIGESVAGGISPQSDAVRGRLALSNAINRRKDIELRLSRAHQKLNALVGIEVEVLPEKRMVLPHVANLENVAVNAADQNPAVLARGAALEGSRKNVVGAKASLKPRLDLTIDYKRSMESVDNLYNVSDTDGGVQLKLTFDIFDLSKKAKIREAYAQVNVNEAQLGKERSSINDEVRALLGDIDITSQQWTISQEATKEADKTRSLYLEEFRLGDRKLSDLITAETEYFTSRNDAIDARYGFIRAVFSIYYLAGKPRDGLLALQLVER